jgi:hypothetical protein
MRRHRTLPAVLLLSVLALAGCNDTDSASSPSTDASSTGSGSPSDSPTGSPTASPTGTSTGSPDTASASPSPHFPTVRIQAARFHAAVLDRNAAKGPQEQAVVDAWMGYWQAVTNTFYYAKPVPKLDDYSTGSARTGVLKYLGQLKGRQQRVVGWARDNVTKVEVDGDRATVRDCTKNFTFSVDEEGTPVTRPTPFYDVSGTLEKREGRWLVTTAVTKNLKASCLG